MSVLTRFFAFSERTTRREYWLIGVAVISLWFVAWAIESFANGIASIGLIIGTFIIALIHTVRRLHDAGCSRWLAAMGLFPFSIVFDVPASVSFDLGMMQLNLFEYERFDFGEVIRAVPWLLALILPSASVSHVDKSAERLVA